jgi:hypothetical protein
VFAPLLLAIAACSGGDAPGFTEARAPNVVVKIMAGDRQTGVTGDTLDLIVARVTNLAGTPQKGVAVTWKVNDQGSISPSSVATDENGLASARWRLGEFDEHEGTAFVKEGAAAAFSADEPAGRILDLLEIGLLRPRTFDGSRETVHPDYVRTPADWGAYVQHLVLTPYPNGANALENPSVFVSRSGDRWFPEAGVINPIVTPDGNGYLSDPDMVYVPNLRELWMYYRKVDAKNHILLVRSTNGSEWGAPVEVVTAKNHLAVSPAIVRRDERTWLMYSVNGGEQGCSDQSSSVELRRSVDGIHWSKPAPVAFSTDHYFTPWHVEVQWIESLKQYWALYPVKRPGSCATQALFLSTSSDGVKWTSYPTPVLKAGDFPELQDIVYRSTFDYDAATDEIRFWFSGANHLGTLYNWRTVWQRQNRSALFARMAAPSSLLLNVMMNRTLPPLLTPP